MHVGRRRDRIGAREPDASVIVYHAIGRVPRDAPGWNGFVDPRRFAEQMAYLRERRHVVTLDALFDSDAGPRLPRVAITFDDGYRSAFEHAVPLLLDLGFPATFFVPTMWIGGRRGWEARGAGALEIMSSDELTELDRAGFAVESHGHAHIDYARAEAAAVRDDMRTSVARLAELLGRPPRYLAYPYGRVVPVAAEEASRLGLRAGFVLDRPQALCGRFALKRVAIVPADARALFALKTAGRYVGWRHTAPFRLFYRAVRPLVRRRWLWP